MQNNRIVANNSFGSNGISMGVDSAVNFTTTATINARVTGNNVSNTDGSGILAVAHRSGTFNARILNNVVAAPVSDTYGMQIRSAASTSNTGTVCVDIAVNNVLAGPTFPGIGLRRQSGTVTNGPNLFGIVGLPTSPAGSPDVENYIGNRNNSATGTFGIMGVGLASATTGFTQCALPF